jgi:hypothetical protein
MEILPYICGMEKKETLNNRLKKTKLNKQWFPFECWGIKGLIKIRVISISFVQGYFDSVEGFVYGIGYNIEVDMRECMSSYNMTKRPNNFNRDIRHAFRYGKESCEAFTIMKYIGCDGSWKRIETIKYKK